MCSKKVHFYDVRNASRPLGTYSDVHTDMITKVGCICWIESHDPIMGIGAEREGFDVEFHWAVFSCARNLPGPV